MHPPAHPAQRLVNPLSRVGRGHWEGSVGGGEDSGEAHGGSLFPPHRLVAVLRSPLDAVVAARPRCHQGLDRGDGAAVDGQHERRLCRRVENVHGGTALAAGGVVQWLLVCEGRWGEVGGRGGGGLSGVLQSIGQKGGVEEHQGLLLQVKYVLPPRPAATAALLIHPPASPRCRHKVERIS